MRSIDFPFFAAAFFTCCCCRFQGLYASKAIYAIVSCQSINRIYYSIMNDTICTSANSAIQWIWFCSFFLSIAILAINIFRFSWQLNEDEIILYDEAKGQHYDVYLHGDLVLEGEAQDRTVSCSMERIPVWSRVCVCVCVCVCVSTLETSN